MLPNFGEVAFYWCVIVRLLDRPKTVDVRLHLNKSLFFNVLNLFRSTFLMNHKWASTLRYPVQKENTDRKKRITTSLNLTGEHT